MVNIPIRSIPGSLGTPNQATFLAMDNGIDMQRTTVQAVVEAGRPVASQAEAQAGADNSKVMTALRVSQAISAIGNPVFVPQSREITAGAGLTGGGTLAANRTFALNSASIASLALADTAIQPGSNRLVPAGGTTGQVLAKTSATDYATAWTAAGAGDMLKVAYDTAGFGVDAFGGGVRKATVAAAIADAPAVDPDYYDIAFYATGMARNSGGRYKKVASEPAHLGKFRNRASLGSWYELDEDVITPQMLGWESGDLTPAFAACVDMQRPIKLPKRAGGYVVNTGFSKVLTAELICDFQGQRIAFDHQRTWEFKGLEVATGRLPSSSRVRYQTGVEMENVAGIQGGDLFYMRNANQAPLSGWGDTKKECVLVTGVSGSTVVLAAGLNFNWTLSAADNFIDIWRPQKVTFLRPNFHLANPVFGQPHYAVHLVGLRDIELISPRLTAPLNLNRETDIYRMGIQIWKCWGWSVTDCYTEGMAYPIGVYGGTRNGFEYRTKAHYCRHGHADLGDFASDYILDGFHATDCYMALSTHPVFRAYATNFDVQNDFDISNWRCIGGGLSNGVIQTTANDAKASAQFNSEAPASGFEYLYDDAEFRADGVEFKAPNRSSLAPFWVTRGSRVYFANISTPVMPAFTSATLVDRLVVGTGVTVAGVSRPIAEYDNGVLAGGGTYTATWTGSGSNPSIGNGAILSTFTKVGNIVKVSIRVSMGSTTTYGSGSWGFSLPFDAANAADVGAVYGLDAGTGFRTGVCIVNSTSPAVVRVVTNGGADYWSSAIPHTWASGDQLNITIVYTAAA